MLRLARQIAAWLLIPLLVVSVVCGVAGRALAASVELFDANIRYTSGIFLAPELIPRLHHPAAHNGNLDERRARDQPGRR